MSVNVYKTRNKEGRMLADALLWAISLFLGLVLGCASASAQMANEPWGFKQQNRASIAFTMRQVEEGAENQTIANTGPSSLSNDILVCGGGGGSSSATGNSTCIILNNATGNLEIGQDALGSQGASSTVPGEGAPSTADEVLRTLGQENSL